MLVKLAEIENGGDLEVLFEALDDIDYSGGLSAIIQESVIKLHDTEDTTSSTPVEHVSDSGKLSDKDEAKIKDIVADLKKKLRSHKKLRNSPKWQDQLKEIFAAFTNDIPAGGDKKVPDDAHGRQPWQYVANKKAYGKQTWNDVETKIFNSLDNILQAPSESRKEKLLALTKRLFIIARDHRSKFIGDIGSTISKIYETVSGLVNVGNEISEHLNNCNGIIEKYSLDSLSLLIPTDKKIQDGLTLADVRKCATAFILGNKDAKVKALDKLKEQVEQIYNDADKWIRDNTTFISNNSAGRELRAIYEKMLTRREEATALFDAILEDTKYLLNASETEVRQKFNDYGATVNNNSLNETITITNRKRGGVVTQDDISRCLDVMVGGTKQEKRAAIGNLISKINSMKAIINKDLDLDDDLYAPPQENTIAGLDKLLGELNAVNELLQR